MRSKGEKRWEENYNVFEVTTFIADKSLAPFAFVFSCDLKWTLHAEFFIAYLTLFGDGFIVVNIMWTIPKEY